MTTDTWEQFVNTTKDATDRGMEAILSSIYIKELRPKLVAEQLLVENSDLVGRPGLTLRIPIRNGYTYPDYYNETGIEADSTGDGYGDGTGAIISPATEEGGTNDIWPQIPYTDPGITWSYQDVSPIKFGHKDIVSSDLQDSANWDVISDKQECLLLGMAEFRDERIWNAILDVTEVVSESHVMGTGVTEVQLTHDGVLEVTLAMDGTSDITSTIESIDYDAGWVKFDTAPVGTITISYAYTTRQHYSVGTATEMGYADLVTANTYIRTQFAVPDTCVVDPLGASLLAQDDKLLDRDMLKTEVLLNGAIGKLAGDQILDTHTLYEGVGVVTVKGMIGYMVYKRKLNAWKERFMYTDGDYFLATTEKSMPAITRSDLIVVLLNAQTDAYIYT